MANTGTWRDNEIFLLNAETELIQTHKKDSVPIAETLPLMNELTILPN